MRKKTTGFTLIEMLVGIVIGMIVVAAASVMMVTVLKSQKDVTASARLNQELGAAMAVMSNEIRRAGFRVCDEEKYVCETDTDSDGIPDTRVPRYNTSAADKDLEIFDGDASPQNSDCILYRYNADVDAFDDLEERRGFRLNGDYIQMAGLDSDVKCNDPVGSTKWENLTNPDLIQINALSFSTTGSKCRNLYKEWYSVISNANESSMPCVSIGVDCTDPSGGACDSDTGDQLFGNRRIIINLQGSLTKDGSVSKNLNSSVKVATPWIGKAL